MDQCERARLTGTIEVALPPEQAFSLFTPSGERSWVDGWDPEFPSPSHDETEPGSVFTTEHGGRRTTWTGVRREWFAAIAYTSVTPGERAGLVSVTLSPAGAGTTVTVSYDLTALTPQANPALRAFAAHFHPFLDGWQDAISRSLAGNQRRRPHAARAESEHGTAAFPVT